MSRILLGVSGGVAAYKALELIRLATAAGHSVRVVQTPASRHFVGEASFRALSGAPVLVSEFDSDSARSAFPGQPMPAHEPLGHLELVANADLFLIAPATANTLAKLAHGMADNLLCSAALAARCPLVVAPAMNNRMYEHVATQANLLLLQERGVHVVEPDVGRLASVGEEGVGRLAEPARLLAACERLLASRSAEVGPLEGVRVLITAGGTREPIDAVRFIGNRSSGLMGLALAGVAVERGASVTLIAANVAAPAPAGVRTIRVGTAAEMQSACEDEFAGCDVLLMAAAVADYRPRSVENGKIDKSARDRLALELEPTADVLSALSARRTEGQTIVGFAAEHGGQGVERARGKLTAKGLDAIAVNDISRSDIGFEIDANEVTLVMRAEDVHVPKGTKAQVAAAILDALAKLRSSS